MHFNIHKLNQELHYHPPWSEDKTTFINLLTQNSFTDDDIILFARLYVKYSHLHCFYISELTHYFTYMLKKMQIYNSTELFRKTKIIYKNKHN